MSEDIFESIRHAAEKRNLRERTIQLYCSDVGCLKWFFNEETKQPNFGFVFYDKTPGGAGHIRRMADPDVLRAVFEASLTQMPGCTCSGESMDTSCYSCLRNYYNQKYHDLLQRGYVVRFLESVLGKRP